MDTRFRLFLIVLMFSALLVEGQSVIHFQDKSVILPIGKSVYFLEDKDGTLSFKDVLKDSAQNVFTLSTAEIPNFANTQSVIWCRFTVQNTSDEPCLLQLAKSMVHHIELYTPQSDGSYTKSVTGALYLHHTRDISDNFFLFRLLPAKVQNPTTFYLMLRSDESLEIPLSIGNAEKLNEASRTEEIIFGIFFGMMFSLLLYNFFLYLSIREKTYLYYVIYILLVLLLNDLMVSGLGFEYLWPNTPSFNHWTYSITASVCFLMILFSSSFLNTGENTPKLNRGFYFFFGCSLLTVFLNIVGQYHFGNILSQLETFLLCLYLIVVGVVAWRKGVKSARFYLIAWSIFLITGIVYVLFLNGLVPANRLTENITLLGTASEGLLLSLALADRINVLRKEKQKAHAERIQLIESQNENLERTVTERTYEIAAQNEELVSQQDQIYLQNEELLLKNEAFTQAQKIIEQQNIELTKYSKGLEKEVALRASELVQSNKELIEQNHQLEQFTFITAHNLRAPVARIQGLGNVLDLNNHNDPERDFIVKKMVDSSRELDMIIHDLSGILQIKKGSIQNYERIELQEKVDRVIFLLNDEILNAQATIHCQLQNHDDLFGLPQYIESILYNLLSNALKYKSNLRSPIIHIRSEKQPQAVILTVSDNGIGLDVDRHELKIFGLYQRFHDHVEGKGLGLHLVKTQVEALGGKISIESKLHEGTTFRIEMPTVKKPEKL